MTTSARAISLYGLMDSACDAPEIRDQSRALSHAPIIDHKTLRGAKPAIAADVLAQRKAGYRLAEDVRYNQRSSAERVNSNLKDSCGGACVRVRGHAKLFSHLMFGIVVLTVEPLMRLVI